MDPRIDNDVRASFLASRGQIDQDQRTQAAITQRTPEREPFLGAILREFVVDFLGILVPGFGFTAALVPALILPFIASIYTPYAIIFLAPQDVREVFAGLGYLFDLFKVELILAVMAFSYVVGSVFFRLDPKIPDARSYWRLDAYDKKTGPVDYGVEESGPIKSNIIWVWKYLKEKFDYHILQSISLDYAVSALNERLKTAREYKADVSTIDFPYPKLKKYLEERNFADLAGYISWEPTGKEEMKKRSKVFINRLKMRLEILYPSHYTRIARNEAHIRLASSSWFACCFIIKMSIIGISLCVILTFVFLIYNPQIRTLANLYAGIFPVATIFAAVWMKDHIERSFHYMRIREVVYVLGMFDFLAQLDPRLLINWPKPWPKWYEEWHESQQWGNKQGKQSALNEEAASYDES